VASDPDEFVRDNDLPDIAVMGIDKAENKLRNIVPHAMKRDNAPSGVAGITAASDVPPAAGREICHTGGREARDKEEKGDDQENAKGR
jgi:hypothetical protein